MSKESRLAAAKNLLKSLEQGDEEVADGLLDEITGLRENQLFHAVERLTRQLHDTVAHFTVDSKIASLDEKDIPDAKERLYSVISMTEQAANQTLNAVENLLLVSEQLNKPVTVLENEWSRFLDREMPFEEFKSMSREIAQHFTQSKTSLSIEQSRLNDILMAQGFQAITGQIIRWVIDLVQNLETRMVELIRISGCKVKPEKVKAGDVAHSQDDVDDRLSSLGL